MSNLKAKHAIILGSILGISGLMQGSEKPKYTISGGTGGMQLPPISLTIAPTPSFTTYHQVAKDVAIANALCTLGTPVRIGSGVRDECLDRVLDIHQKRIPVSMGTVGTGSRTTLDPQGLYMMHQMWQKRENEGKTK